MFVYQQKFLQKYAYKNMNFRTSIDFSTVLCPPPISYADKLFLVGSCFAENIGARLKDLHYPLIINPFGISYNPISIANQLQRMAENRLYTDKELLEENGRFLSFAHHGRFSADTAEQTLAQINTAFAAGRAQMLAANTWVITLGTAYIYSQKTRGEVVNNCHRQRAQDFTRRRLSVDEVVAAILAACPLERENLKIILTVSPVRHLKDGLAANQLSKSTLLLACAALQAARPEQFFYFPAYEIMMDDLRDYRFYADDFLHPSSMAIDYIWQLFEQNYLSASEATTRQKISDLQRAATHRPFNPQTAAHQKFVAQQLQKIEQLQKQWRQLDFSALAAIFEAQLLDLGRRI
jgi:hypothetical protein